MTITKTDLKKEIADRKRRIRELRGEIREHETTIGAFEKAIAALDGPAPKAKPVTSTRKGKRNPKREHLDKVILDEVRKNGGEVWQNTLVDAWPGGNPGTVSGIVRRLEADGLVVRERHGRQITIRLAAEDAARETVVHAGEGVRSGRRRDTGPTAGVA